MSQVEQPKRRFRVTRRGFLIGLGVTGATLAVGVAAGRRPFYRFMAETVDSGDTGDFGAMPNDAILWFEISPDNTILFYNPKVEMGQGIHTSMAQVAAEELGVRWDQIEVIQSGTANGVQDQFTGGSFSISSSFLPLRQAAATMREMLKIKAAEQLAVAVSDLDTAEATIFVKGDPSTSLTYAEAAQGVTEWPELEEEPVLKPASQFEFIGQSLPRVDFESKLTGQASYGYDMRVEGMAYGAVARPPSITSTMASASEGEAMSRPGVIAVAIDVDKGLAGVVAKTRQQAQSAVNFLEIEWDEGRVWEQADVEALMDVSDRAGLSIQLEGNPRRVIGSAPTLSAEYFTPFAAHAHLEAQAALADVKSDRAEIWSSAQGAGSIRGPVAEVTGLPEESITATPTYLGGGFGRKIGGEVAREAAFLSKAAGMPVHVAWTRFEDMRHGFFRPATKSFLTAKIENDKIVAINHNHSSGEVAFPFFPSFLRVLFGADFGSWRGGMNFYAKIENRQLSTHLADFPIPTGWWRGLGLLANVFTTESFMDELAHSVGADPLQFRLDHLGDDAFGERMKAVLVAAAEKAGYGQPLPEGHAHGIAASVDVNTVAAMVAEVSVDDSGQIVVHRAVQAIDPGLVVNPDGATAQVQGSIIMGLSSTLLEEITIAGNRIEAGNFDRYPLITNDMSPEIDVVLLESDGKPRGMGEPPIGPVAAAVGNAVFNATGKRVRRLPMTPERVMAA